jgi:para-aminobenzoate synthetase component 1
MFLAVGADGAVETRPIKGTRPRGSDRLQDEELAAQLLASGKDRAENLMIVDLLRNDLSRVCVAGSVHVAELCALESWASVHHLVSTVRGRLRAGVPLTTLLQATFPGGSITGAPKERAMQIIAEIEGAERGVYCGAIGYFSPGGGLLLNVAIRTLVFSRGRAVFSAGGGIVLESDPGLEYEETLAKGRGMLTAITSVNPVP